MNVFASEILDIHSTNPNLLFQPTKQKRQKNNVDQEKVIK
jgi:hypothetical protein